MSRVVKPTSPRRKGSVQTPSSSRRRALHTLRRSKRGTHSTIGSKTVAATTSAPIDAATAADPASRGRGSGRVVETEDDAPQRPSGTRAGHDRQRTVGIGEMVSNAIAQVVVVVFQPGAVGGPTEHEERGHAVATSTRRLDEYTIGLTDGNDGLGGGAGVTGDPAPASDVGALVSRRPVSARRQLTEAGLPGVHGGQPGAPGPRQPRRPSERFAGGVGAVDTDDDLARKCRGTHRRPRGELLSVLLLSGEVGGVSMGAITVSSALSHGRALLKWCVRLRTWVGTTATGRVGWCRR